MIVTRFIIDIIRKRGAKSSAHRRLNKFKKFILLIELVYKNQTVWIFFAQFKIMIHKKAVPFEF